MIVNNINYFDNLIMEIFNLIPNNNKIYLGLSGGVDSITLLHMMNIFLKKNTYFKKELTCIHINHSISKNSLYWELFCEKLCSAYNIKFIKKTINCVNIKGRSFEEIARDKRYEFFLSLIKKDDIFLTAHHLNDNIETFFLNFLRGSGISGLSGIKKIRSFGDGFLVRPMLEIKRKQIVDYALENNLNWIEDESNIDPKIPRNFIRNIIFPILEKKWPSFEKCISRTIAHCSAGDKIINTLAKDDFISSAIHLNKNLVVLSIKNISSLEIERQINVIRYWLRKFYKIILSEVKIFQIINDIIRSKSDSMPFIKCGTIFISKYNNNIYILNKNIINNINYICKWDIENELILPENIGILKINQNKSFIETFKNMKIEVCFRDSLGFLYPNNSKLSKKIKKIFQSKEIPFWERNITPIIIVNGTFFCIVDIFFNSKEFKDKHFYNFFKSIYFKKTS